MQNNNMYLVYNHTNKTNARFILKLLTKYQNKDPKKVADVLNLYVFSIDEIGFIKQFSPDMFGTKYCDDDFHQK